MQPIKLSFVVTGLRLGGAEMMLLKVLENIDRERFHPEVVALSDSEGIIVEKLRQRNIPVQSLNIREGRWSISGLLRLREVLRRFSPDIIQGWMYHGNIAAQFASMLPGIKAQVVWNIRGTHTDLTREGFSTASTIWAGGALSNLPSRIVNNSRRSAYLHGKLLRYSRDHEVIIPNGFDTQLFRPNREFYENLRNALGFNLDTKIVGHIGRYHPMKDHETFLRACAIMLVKHPKTQFIAVGTDVAPTNNKLRELVLSLGLEKSVHLLGERQNIFEVAAGFDLCTLTSKYGEGFPNVVGEAMACGVPCVVTDVGDAAWLVGKSGIVVPTSSPQALADAWDIVLYGPSSTKTEFSRLARERITSTFSIIEVVKLYEYLYEQVFAENWQLVES